MYSRGEAPKRRRLFVGCEGDSEQSYARFLGKLFETAELHVHLDTFDLNGGGPRKIVGEAIGRIAEQERLRGPYAARFLFLDHDKCGTIHGTEAQITAMAAQNKLHLIWQRPCHEAFLLRHIDGCHTHRPPTASAAHKSLKVYWPDYAKGWPAAQLARLLDQAAVRRAMAVEPDLAIFLKTIRFS